MITFGPRKKTDFFTVLEGGLGSGNRGHAGIKGHWGGSAPKKGGAVSVGGDAEKIRTGIETRLGVKVVKMKGVSDESYRKVIEDIGSAVDDISKAMPNIGSIKSAKNQLASEAYEKRSSFKEIRVGTKGQGSGLKGAEFGVYDEESAVMSIEAKATTGLAESIKLGGGWSPIGYSARSTLRHEMGHVILNSYFRRKEPDERTEFSDSLNKFLEKNKMHTDQGGDASFKKYFKKSVGGYAANDVVGEEAFAEAFMVYTSPSYKKSGAYGTKSRLPKEIEGLFDNVNGIMGKAKKGGK